jgi:hypothetical protein
MEQSKMMTELTIPAYPPAAVNNANEYLPMYSNKWLMSLIITVSALDKHALIKTTKVALATTATIAIDIHTVVAVSLQPMWFI